MSINYNNILITGGSGMVGSCISFGIKPSSTEMNICQYESIKQYINNKSIEFIIHLASTNLRDSEENIKKAIDTNINGTINLLNIAQELNIPIMYISSGAVFSSSNIYDTFSETSIPNPNCIYGTTKNDGEKTGYC